MVQKAILSRTASMSVNRVVVVSLSGG